MVKLNGTYDRDTLVGSDRKDIIHGRGGADTIFAEGGNDVVTGRGTIDLGTGDDAWYGLHSPIRSSDDLNFGGAVAGGDGDDVFIKHHSYRWMSAFLGPGDDMALYGYGDSSSGIQTMGVGADRVYILDDSHRLTLSTGPSEYDNDVDYVHIDAANAAEQISIYGFGEEDILHIHNTELGYRDLRDLSVVRAENSQFTEIVLYLPGDLEVKIWKEEVGELRRSDVVLNESAIRVRGEAVIGEEGRPQPYYMSGSGDDRLKAGTEALFLGGGDDRGRGTRHDDTIYGDDGDDRIVGRRGDDALFGNEGDDTLVGGPGRDRLEIGAGEDVARGGAGSDTFIVEGAGMLEGGGGGDIFRFRPFAEGEVRGNGGRDKYYFDEFLPRALVIHDFRPGKDKIFFDPTFRYTPAEIVERSRETDGSGTPFDRPGVILGGTDILLAGLRLTHLSEADLIV